jgi:hypothetical protein
MHHLTALYRDQYNAASKKEKGQWVHRVIREIRQMGGKFVQIRSNEGDIPASAAAATAGRDRKDFVFDPVDDATAYKKVSHAFRSKGRIRMSATSGTTASSATGMSKHELLHSGVVQNQVASAGDRKPPAREPQAALPAEAAAASRTALSYLLHSRQSNQQTTDPTSSLLASLIQSNPAILSLLPSLSGQAAASLQQQNPPPSSMGTLANTTSFDPNLTNMLFTASSLNNPVNLAIASLAATLTQQQQQLPLQQQNFFPQQQLQQPQLFHAAPSPQSQLEILPLLISMLSTNWGVDSSTVNPFMQQSLQLAQLASMQQQQLQHQQQQLQNISTSLSPAAPHLPQAGMVVAMNQQLFELLRQIAASGAHGGGGSSSNGDANRISSSDGNDGNPEGRSPPDDEQNGTTGQHGNAGNN